MKKYFIIFIISLFALNSNIAQACTMIPSGIPEPVYIQPIVTSGFGSMKIPAENLYIEVYTYQTGISPMCLFPKTVHVNIVWLGLFLLAIGFIVGRKINKK